MDIKDIPVISVSYNSAELIEDLLSSFRRHYDNPITIVDGSDVEFYKAIEAVCANYSDVNFIHFDYNIHHGPGMAWAFQNLDIHGPLLVLDSDVVILKAGFLESMAEQLEADMYGVGYVNHVNEGGFDVDYKEGAVPYLHPACMLCNSEVLKMWPMPIKHGAPMTAPMVALHRAGKSHLIKGLAWLKDDFAAGSDKPERHFIRHDWQGTVTRTGSYNLTEWEKAARHSSMTRQLLLTLVPCNAEKVIEVGNSDGALARLYKEAHPGSHYTSIDIGSYGQLAVKGMRDQILRCDPETVGDDFFRPYHDVDCWIFDTALERMKNPAGFLERIRKVMKSQACIVAILPNSQHWSVLCKLCIGDLRYNGEGGIDPEQLHWYSRATMFELFQSAGFQILGGLPVIHDRLENATVLAAIRELASSVGANPELAIEDALPIQYIFKITPK